MSRTRPPYTKDFRKRMVELARAGCSVSELAEEFEPSDQTIRSRIKKADVEDGVRSNGSTAAEHEKLRQLRRELRRLKQERDILAMRKSSCDMAWFARGTGEVPKSSSHSRAHCQRVGGAGGHPRWGSLNLVEGLCPVVGHQLAVRGARSYGAWFMAPGSWRLVHGAKAPHSLKPRLSPQEERRTIGGFGALRQPLGSVFASPSRHGLPRGLINKTIRRSAAGHSSGPLAPSDWISL